MVAGAKRPHSCNCVSSVWVALVVLTYVRAQTGSQNEKVNFIRRSEGDRAGTLRDTRRAFGKQERPVGRREETPWKGEHELCSYCFYYCS
jgi:hypothetical protein